MSQYYICIIYYKCFVLFKDFINFELLSPIIENRINSKNGVKVKTAPTGEYYGTSYKFVLGFALY